MNTREINHILKTDGKTKGIFEGVYPSDRLHFTSVPRPSAFVINLDTSDKVGSHWVAVYYDGRGNADFFL